MKLYALVNNRSDDKSHLSVYYVAVLRALGLPAAYEYIDRWGNFSVNGHSWVSYIGEKERAYTIANGDSVLRTMNPIDASMVKEHYYHLYYFDSEWISLGEQVATSNLLTYNNAPRGALFLLKNLSKGREERVFTMEEGRLVWW
ncbi:hypothetical protein [Sphingobacterium sp. FBM7-1]|uniref:hypothetical protein n=1 Tax=Sphingobacterium sp. FBM7-1 TaxID=2886688 RepID=UPI001D0F5A3E|nr:hypothetical protein [Sphingobacterium sp. FBM7-1]MCC2599272.1 hypothetical protein [Sphingobacterium sp. FBM7-1]